LIKSPTGLGISASCSFQSHISTGKSHQRLRLGAHSSSSKPLVLNPPSVRQPPALTGCLGPSVGAEYHFSRLLSWPKFWFQWVAFTYCCLSVIFLSASIFARLYHRENYYPTDFQSEFLLLLYLGCRTNEISHLVASTLSPLSDLSNQQRLSIVSSLHPQPRHFEPFVLRGAETYGITACLWSHYEDINALPAWASRWTGEWSSPRSMSPPIDIFVRSSLAAHYHHHGTFVRHIPCTSE
jgi:hypothetical protein